MQFPQKRFLVTHSSIVKLCNQVLPRFGNMNFDGAPIQSSSALVRALEERRAFFRRAGATSTDHGVVEPYTERLHDGEAETLFARALAGQATAADQRRYEAHLLMEMARMSASDGLVMQLHAGAFRDHNETLRERFGPDRGGDIPVMTEFTRNLRPLLNAYGNDPAFRIILYTLDESTYSRELAPLAGHYPAVRLGAPWWFHDSLEGMLRYRERTTESAGIDRTAGFADDTRAFCSIPARHDLARRVDACTVPASPGRESATVQQVGVIRPVPPRAALIPLSSGPIFPPRFTPGAAAPCPEPTPARTVFEFRIDATDGAARTGSLALPHGEVRTPVFMPVGTLATVKTLTTEEVEALGAEIILNNTYHLYLRPGVEVVEAMGRLHSFQGWKRPKLTD